MTPLSFRKGQLPTTSVSDKTIVSEQTDYKVIEAGDVSEQPDYKVIEAGEFYC